MREKIVTDEVLYKSSTHQKGGAVFIIKSLFKIL